jgi:hypothetical protein
MGLLLVEGEGARPPEVTILTWPAVPSRYLLFR